MFMIEYKQLSWWYWLITVCLLTAGLAGYQWGFLLAIAFTLFQLIHFTIQERSISSFPVQVRFWYLVFLLISLPEPLQILYWLPAIGTWAQIFTGYCMMARLVSLFPWNRSEPFSTALIRRTFLSRPVKGNILQGLPPISQGK